MNVSKYFNTNGVLQPSILLLLIAITLVIYFLITRFFKDSKPKYFLAALFLGIFLYSGFGIAYDDIDDRFVIHYTIFLASFGFPFIYCGKIKPCSNLTPFDASLIKNIKKLRIIAFFYLFLNLIPLIFPEFRLFDLFSFKSESIHVLRAISRGDTIVRIADLLGVLIAPFFYASFSIEQELNPKTKKPVIYFIILIILEYGRYNYIGRYMIMTDIANMFLLLYCVKGFTYKIKLKHILIALVIVLSMVPILYLYTFIRSDEEYIGDTSFFTLFSLLIRSEFYYPAFYSDTLKHLSFMGESIEHFISYVLCLPIPSFIWPDKPSYDAIRSFTYLFTGYVQGDSGFFILLPSILGESFINGGEKWFWVFGLISGTVISIMFRYLCSKKSLTFYSFFIIIYGFSYARGGTMVLLPILTNGSMAVLLYDLYIKSKIKKRKKK